MRKILGAVCAITLMFAAPTMADVLDFESESEGDIVSSVTGSGGLGPVGVNGINPNLVGDPNAAMIFDSDCDGGCTGEDPDLGSPNEAFGGPGIGDGGTTTNNRALGNVLIVSEDLDQTDPDDVAVQGAELALDFSAIAPVTIVSMDLLDVEGEEDGGVIVLLDAGMGMLAMFEIPTVGDNGLENIGLGPTPGVSYVRVILNGSGAIDNIVFRRDGEGCTPGYWKQPHHFDSWDEAYDQDDLFNTVFGTSWSFNARKCGSSNPTLLQALRCRGGGAKALARHATAALLNSASGIDYALDTASVIDLVKAALDSGSAYQIQSAKNELAGYNEEGCPLN